MPVRPRQPTYTISYQGTDVSGEIAAFVEKIEITEELEGKADTLSIKLNNADFRWFNEWTPNLGDRISVAFGYVGEGLSEPITFEVDEPTYEFGPDIMSLKGTATPITETLRQRRSVGFEGFSLAELAAIVADRHGLTLVGKVPEIVFERVTQKNEMDLGWLKKLALRFGVIFKVESCEKLVFFVEKDLETLEPFFMIRRQTEEFEPGETPTSGGLPVLFMAPGAISLKKKSSDTYKSARAVYKDPKTQEVYETVVPTANPEIGSADELNITGERMENPEQTALRAEEALRKANSTLVEGSFNMEGEQIFRAGTNFELSTDRNQFGVLGGKFQMRSVKHVIIPKAGPKMGWRSDFEARKIFE